MKILNEFLGLHGSHGFITQHAWAKDVKAFINLESTASGGKEILFQSGPKNSWIVDLYSAVKRPFAQVMGEELFQSGLTPHFTDFQIFVEYGGVPGLDFAHIKDGYRYHTKYDDVKYLPREFLQHTGENILELTKAFANSDILPDAKDHADSASVYYDFLGWFFVSYTRAIGVTINIIVALVAFILPVLMQTRPQYHTQMKEMIIETLVAFSSILIGTVVCLGVCYLLALLMNGVDRTMSW